MTLAGIQMRVVGRDATPMRGRDGTDTSYETDTINIGPGESFDVIFTAPPHSGPGLRHLHALQPQLHAVEQPGAGRFRRPGHRDPGVLERRSRRRPIPMIGASRPIRSLAKRS